MRWQDARRSDNVEDRRGMGGGFGGGGMRMGGLGLGGLLVLMLLGWLLGGDPLALLDQGPIDTGTSAPAGPPPANDPAAQQVSAVLADTEDTWTALFREIGRSYEQPRLVLFDDAVQSACGMNSSAVGPFYCPGDRKVYIDLSFYRELDQRFGAPGDFAQAYVVAHEVGHHVQNLLGIFDRLRSQRVDQATANALSVRQELQADCFAGVWGHHTGRATGIRLDPGDVEEGLNAAAAIGDDRIQRRSQGRVSPESFTHGSSAQRVEWLRRGLESGRIDSCDTFANR